MPRQARVFVTFTSFYTPRVEHKWLASTLLWNFRGGCKCFTAANALAYCWLVKKFYCIGPWFYCQWSSLLEGKAPMSDTHPSAFNVKWKMERTFQELRSWWNKLENIVKSRQECFPPKYLNRPGVKLTTLHFLHNLRIGLHHPPGACIIKHITAVIYSFRNKLEHLSLNTRLGRKGLPGTNTLAYYGNRKLRP